MRNLIIPVVILIAIVGGYFLLRGTSQNKTSTPTVTNEPATTSATPSANASDNNQSETTIKYTSAGFSPENVTIKSGGKITWVNDSSEEVQIGANPHPIHTGNKEVSGGDFTLNLAPGESKSVTITKTGSFGYHNHRNSSQGGTINVK
ncbi:MAG: cupredoxin domain-containing protein [bacterium]|nr:cupredoxin domain-containing protein [bacterium]